MEHQEDDQPRRRAYEAPHIVVSARFETLAMTCGKQVPDPFEDDVCNGGPLSNS